MILGGEGLKYQRRVYGLSGKIKMVNYMKICISKSWIRKENGRWDIKAKIGLYIQIRRIVTIGFCNKEMHRISPQEL